MSPLAGRTLLAASCAALAVSAATPGTSPASETARAGRELFAAHCASCHGPGGRGDGPRAAQLRYPPSDLTRLAAEHEGRFPFVTVRRIVDGREVVKGHLAGGDMPAWGDALKRADEGYREAPAQQRLESIVQYLATIQRSQEER